MSQKRSNNKHLCERKVHVEKIMAKTSLIRVSGGGGDRRIRKNGQTINQFVQLTLLKVGYSHMESVMTEFMQRY